VEFLRVHSGPASEKKAGPAPLLHQTKNVPAMKTTFLSLLGLAMFTYSEAQLSINHFFPGNPKTAIGVTPESSLNLTGGQNQVWDYSNFSPNGENYEVRYVDASPELIDQFPGTTLAIKITDLGEDAFYALKKTPVGWEQTGLQYSYEGQPAAIHMQNPKLFLPNSFSFGNAVTDTFYSVLDLSQAGFDMKIGTAGELLSTVDATGTLLLPNGQTISGVTRMATRERYTDTVILNIPGFPSDPELVEGRVHTYNWYKHDGSGNPLLFSLIVDSTFADGQWNVEVSAVYLNPSQTTGTAQNLVNFGHRPFPNRVEQVLHLPLGQGQVRPSRVVVTDASGRGLVNQKGEELAMDEGNLQLHLGHLSPGIYFVSIELSDGSTTRPWRIQKL
jgi:hypothetical protein